MTIEELVEDSSANTSEGHSADEVIERTCFTAMAGNPDKKLGDLMRVTNIMVCCRCRWTPQA